MALFNHSPYEALCSAYPKHKWLPWLFNHVPKGFWTRENQLLFMEYVRKQMRLHNLSDLYSLSKDIISYYGGTFAEFALLLIV